MSSTQSEGEQRAFASAVSAMTGLDPRVIRAQMIGEGAPGNGPGYFNYLNIATTTAEFNGSPVAGTGPAGTAKFGTFRNGVIATATEYRKLGITGAAGKTPRQQITAIGNSGWASSHYGNPPGANLVADFQSLFPHASLDAPGVHYQQGPGSFTGTYVAGLGDIGHGAANLPVVKQVIGIGDFLGKLTDPSYILRGLQIVAGAGLVAGGIVLLVRQVALAQDIPDPLAGVAGPAVKAAGRAGVTGDRRAAGAFRTPE